MGTITATTTLDVQNPVLPVTPAPDYTDTFIKISPSTRLFTINHPGIPFLGSTHIIPLHQIQSIKSAAELNLESSEYKVWGVGPSWIWWAWDLRRAGLLKRTERDRYFVAKIEVGWITLSVGFTVEHVDEFQRTLQACRAERVDV